MPSIELLRPELHGARFKLGSIPLEMLPDLFALGRLIKQVVKWHFFEEHPHLGRLPYGFNTRADLIMTKVDVGSSIPVIDLVTLDNLPPPDLGMYRRLFESAVHDIVSAIDDAGQNGSTSPNEHIPARYLAHFNGIGRHLRDDESMDFFIPHSQISARLDRITRRELLKQSSMMSRTDEITLVGSVSETNQDKMSFELQLLDGTKVQAPLPEQHYDAIMEATRQYRTGGHVQIRGNGMYDQQNRLMRLESVVDVARVAFPSAPLVGRRRQQTQVDEQWGHDLMRASEVRIPLVLQPGGPPLQRSLHERTLDRFRQAGLEKTADRLNYLREMSETHTEEQAVRDESLETFAAFILNNPGLDTEAISVSAEANVSAQWFLSPEPSSSDNADERRFWGNGRGMIGMQFLPNGIVRYAANSGPSIGGVERLRKSDTCLVENISEELARFLPKVIVS